MTDFGFYFRLGWEHIMSFSATDHQLFILMLAVIYLLRDWKQVLVLVTAFTIGHSVTLALTVYNIIRVPTNWVEILIPCTIIITAISNLLIKNFTPKTIRINYFLALFFGLIHGMGFANTLRYILAEDQDIGWSLFGFNVGLEAGQIVIVILILLVSFFIVEKSRLNRRWWIVIASSATLIFSIKMLIERIQDFR